MAHFQLPVQSRRYGTVLGGTRLFQSGVAGDETIVIETGKRVSLQVAGVSGAAPTITQVPLASVIAQRLGLTPPSTSSPPTLSLSSLSGGGASRILTITAVRPGVSLLYADGANPIGVFVGNFQNHPGMKHDLIADVFRGSDPARMHVLTRALFSNVDNLFNEKSAYNIGRWGVLACGTVSKVGGAAVFYDKLDYDYKEYYHKPVSGKTREDIRIDSTKLDKGLKAIQSRLAKGIPSVVGLVYSPTTAVTSSGYVDVNGTGGHTVPIVGCSSDRKKFLYIDVYQEGSRLKYDGGHAGLNLFYQESDCLGMFELQADASRGTDILRSTTPGKAPVFSGTQFLEVVAGPLTP